MNQNKNIGQAERRLTGLRFLGLTCLVAVIAVGIVAAVSAQIGAGKETAEAESRKPMVNKTDSESVLKQASKTDNAGQIRPLTAQEAQQLADGLKVLVNRSEEGLKQVRNDDGSVSMDLEGRFQNVTVAKQNADGTVETSCIDNLDSAASFFEIDPKRFGKKNNPAVKRPVVDKDENGAEIK